MTKRDSLPLVANTHDAGRDIAGGWGTGGERGEKANQDLLSVSIPLKVRSLLQRRHRRISGDGSQGATSELRETPRE